MKLKKKNVSNGNLKINRVAKNAITKKSAKASGAPVWKKVKLAGKLLSDEGGADLEGLLGLEVLENVNGALPVTKEKPVKQKKHKVVLSDSFSDSDSEGDNESRKDRKKKKKKKKTKTAEPTAGRFVLLKPNVESSAKDTKKLKNSKAKKESGDKENENGNTFSLDDMSEWNGLGVPEPILKVLAEKGFKQPTEIQRLTLPSAIMGRRDILGAAETGSGKTLAFGIPILNGIMQLKKSPEKRAFRKLSKKSIIELQQQNEVKEQAPQNNIRSKSKPNRNDRDNWTPPPDEIDNFPDFGRVLEDQSKETDDDSEQDSKPLYALVLTPTRELAVQVKDHIVSAAKYTDIRVATVFGGMAAVKQERMLAKCPEIVVATPGRLWELISEGNKHLSKLKDINFLVVDETDRMIEKGHFEELKQILERLNVDPVKRVQRQNFVFSATLTLIHELPQYLRMKNMNRKRKFKPQTAEQKLQAVIDYFGISQPKIVDITPSQTTGGTAEKLTECRITCAREQKDLYLYYFLQKHPGRTIVFCNSVECVRRLAKLFAILQCEPRPLHAKMAQRQRLKNLERFTASPTGLLIATDVAARGLDIPNVEHVIHYQVPRTSENYIHRSGRTARGNKEGIAVLFMEPGEVQEYIRLCKSLKRNEDLPLFPITDRYLSAVRDRVNLATQIDGLELKMRRKNMDIGWLKKSAKEMDILIDDESDFSEADLYDSDDGGGAVERSLERRELKQKQETLKRLLAKPIFPKGVNYNYPSSMTPVDDSVASDIPYESKDKAVIVMKNAIENYKLAKKQRNKKTRKL